MKNPTYQFIGKLISFSLLISVVAAILFLTVMKKWYFPSFPIQLLFIALVTGISYIWLLKYTEQNMRKFTTAFMALVSIKLFIYLSFLLINLWIDRSNVVVFSLTFLVLYVCYSIFEVKQILFFLKK